MGLHRFCAHMLLTLVLVPTLYGCGAGREDALPPPKAALVAEQAPASPTYPAGRPALLAAETLSAEARLDLAVLQAAYPGAVLGLEPMPGGPGGGPRPRLNLVLAGGRRLPYDDGRERTHRQALESPDIRTTLAQVYPLGPVTQATARPAPDFEPGRSRVQAFFATLYGHTEAEVRASCVAVRFDGHGVLFNGRHGAAAALERVARRIERLKPTHPEMARALRPLGGTLAWRNIAASTRLSSHAFAVSIDLNPHLPYWLTERRPEHVPALVRSFPPELLAAFEAEGFIWGGKWASFDLMHFEYRPELILKARALAGEIRLPEPGVTAPPQ